MGKRSDFERKERDYYVTPIEAVKPLVPHLPLTFTYIEPCAGNGALIRHLEELEKNAHCLLGSDIEPVGTNIIRKDFFDLSEKEVEGIDLLITNPPWDRKFLHPMIEKCMTELNIPTWLLFDADWVHTKQSKYFVERYLDTIVSIGRVKWFPDSKMTGKDNCCWYLFNPIKLDISVTFHGR